MERTGQFVQNIISKKHFIGIFFCYLEIKSIFNFGAKTPNTNVNILLKNLGELMKQRVLCVYILVKLKYFIIM